MSLRCLVFYDYILASRRVQNLADFVTILPQFVSILLRILKPEAFYVQLAQAIRALRLLCLCIYL